MNNLQRISRLRTWALMCVLALTCGVAGAAEIMVLTAGASKPVVTALVPEFEQRTGHKLVVDNDTAGALVKRIGGGEVFDLLVVTPAALEQLAVSGQVLAGSQRRLARVAIGVAVKQGAPKPDTSSVAALRQALLSASGRAQAVLKDKGMEGP